MQVLAASCEPVSAMTGKEALDLHAVRLTYDCVKPKFWPRGADMHGKNTRMFIILSLRRTEDDLKVRYRSSLFRVHRFLFKVHIWPVGILHICNLWIQNCSISCWSKTSSSWTFFVVNVDGSDPGICLITPGCFNIQTSNWFANFCLFPSNSTDLVQTRGVYFQFVYNYVLSL